MARRRRGAALHAEPNIIPFIDVLLVLLVVFMVAAPASTVDLRLELPRSGVARSEFAPIIVDVGVGPDGLTRYSIAGRSVDLAQLAGLAEQAAPEAIDARSEARIFVRADQSVAYGAVVAAIDTLQHDGFAHVGLFAQSADSA
jgi:biopolymer transport protein ExbD